MANTAGHRNVQFTVGSSEVDHLPGCPAGNESRGCSSARLVRILIGYAKGAPEKTAKSRVLVAYLARLYVTVITGHFEQCPNRSTVNSRTQPPCLRSTCTSHSAHNVFILSPLQSELGLAGHHGSERPQWQSICRTVGHLRLTVSSPRPR